jgi:OOP family OmpA-OmpF porin
MAIDLVELVKGYLTPDVIQRAASYAGESSAATQKALGGIVPTLVGALTNMGSTNEGAQQLVRMLDAGKYDGSGLKSVTSLFGGGVATQGALGAGKGILESLFGAKVSGVIDFIARMAGVRTDSASSLLALAAPLVLHVLGQQRATIGPSAGSLASLLGEQRSFLAGLIPAGLGSLLGWTGLTSGVSELGASAAGAASRVTREVADRVPSPSRLSWALPLIILGALVVGALAWLSWPTTTPTALVGQAGRRISELQLPGGGRISVPEGSFNFSVASWLASTTDTRVPKRFVFEDLNFETGSTRLTPESGATVTNLVAVLKAYPEVSVALEGHTDNTGDPTANKKLSLDRAGAVKALMVAGGIGEGRISSAGYGQDNPVAPNDTEEGRSKNRRLELVVVKR